MKVTTPVKLQNIQQSKFHTDCLFFVWSKIQKTQTEVKKKSGWRAGEQRKFHWITFYKLAITDRLIYDFTIDTNTDIQ